MPNRADIKLLLLLSIHSQTTQNTNLSDIYPFVIHLMLLFRHSHKHSYRIYIYTLTDLFQLHGPTSRQSVYCSWYGNSGKEGMSATLWHNVCLGRYILRSLKEGCAVAESVRCVYVSCFSPLCVDFSHGLMIGVAILKGACVINLLTILEAIYGISKRDTFRHI